MQDGTWAGHIELQAASLALKSNISVYQAGQPVWTIKNFAEVSHDYIIMLAGLHNLLFPTRWREEQPVWSITILDCE